VDKVSVRGDTLTSVGLLKGISATPDSKGQHKQGSPSGLGTGASAHALSIKQISPNGSSDNLSHPVQQTVEGLCAGIEVGAVDSVLLVDVEPVGDEEHGEEKDDERLEAKSLPKTPELALPGWVLHEDDTGAVSSNDLAGIAKGEGENGTEEHEDDEADVRSITDCLVLFDVDVFTERDLPWVNKSIYERARGHTRPPITAPMLKIPQNQAKYFPFMFS
jgi:hypothetical protein